MARPFQIVAIDGGAASGKSSTARAVAERLNFLHVDTGTHYRAITLACLNNSIEPSEGSSSLCYFLQKLRIKTEIQGREALIRLNGAVPKEEDLRSDSVNQNVSRFAALPDIRKSVRLYQQRQADIAKENGFNGLIMGGRDIGTVIFPSADLKIFLIADEATRTARRQKEGLTDSIASRDQMDKTRTAAPLLQAEDAQVIDNSKLSLDEVVTRILRQLDRSCGSSES